MKKLLFMLLTVMSCTICTGQESYEQALKEYLSLNGTSSQMIDSNKIKSLLEEVNKQLLNDKDLPKSDELIEEYAASQMEKDMMSNVLIPMFKESVSEQDLKELVTMMNSKEGKQWKDNSEKAISAWGLNLGMSAMSIMLSDDDDETNNGLTPNKDCTKSYQELFNQYYEDSQIEQLMNTMLPSMIPQAMKKLPSNEKVKKMFDKYRTYVQKNMKTLMLNCMFGTMTEGDLKFGINMFKKASYQNFIKAASKSISNIQEYGLAILNCYTTWLQEEKGITLKTEQ